ncbi:MAG: hypothetical protein WCV85_01990 [Patescibacteria group bacterium]|jgi:hypothetical protein
MNIFSLFKPKKLDQEAFEAYWHRLPNNLAIQWFRDGKYIVGNIQAEGEVFMTQGRTADEFIDMVNETVYAVYNIPKEYFSLLKLSKEFKPVPEEYAKLHNASIHESSLSLKKSIKPQLA